MTPVMKPTARSISMVASPPTLGRVGHCPNFCQNDAKFSGFTMVKKNTIFVDVETLETFLWKCEIRLSPFFLLDITLFLAQRLSTKKKN